MSNHSLALDSHYLPSRLIVLIINIFKSGILGNTHLCLHDPPDSS